jgi:ceramide synthetase
VESGFRFTFYTVTFLLGCLVLYDKPWTWDSNHYFIGHPGQELTADVYYFYMLQMGYYLQAVVTIHFESAKKDYWQHVVHHLVTITLIHLSWMLAYVRFGSIVLIIHDASDVWMEAARLGRYLHMKVLSACCFVVFVMVWCVTRLVIFPYKCIFPIYWGAVKYDMACPVNDVFIALLSSLYVLHIIWTYRIFMILYDVLFRSENFYDGKNIKTE